jgi:hypothetical protein
MKLSRRKFGRVLASGAIGAPFIVKGLAQTVDQVPSDAIDLGMKVINIKMSEARAEGVREALKNTAKQVAAIRAYPLKRDAQPALVLGVFDA